MPVHLGTWVFACTPQGDLIKWGKDGDTVSPYPPDDRHARLQAAYLMVSDAHKEDTLYIVHVFDNGQLKQMHFSSADAIQAVNDARWTANDVGEVARLDAQLRLAEALPK